LNANVFYELGVAHAEGKPVIHIAHRETKLPFDNIGYRAVMFDPSDWDSHVDAKVQIAEAARNALTQGSAISNPVTHARGWEKLKRSADPEQAKAIIRPALAECYCGESGSRRGDAQKSAYEGS
jgi:hypothetical protein